MASDNDTCELCGATKAEHTGMNHQFSLDGSLTPTQTAKSTPASNASAAKLEATLTRLLAILMAKGILTEPELMAILGVSDVPDRQSGDAAAS